MMAHDKATVEDRTTALKSARKTIESYGGDWRTAAIHASNGGDASKTRGIDVAADSLAKSYPHLFPDQEHTHNTDRLFDMLSAGNPQPMTEEHAYEQAMDELRRYGPTMKEKNYRKGGKVKTAADEEPIPFSADALAGAGRFVGFGQEQPRVPAGSPEGGEWMSGGADPFQAFRAPTPAQGSLFGAKASDVKPTDPKTKPFPTSASSRNATPRPGTCRKRNGAGAARTSSTGRPEAASSRRRWAVSTSSGTRPTNTWDGSGQPERRPTSWSD